MMTRVPIISAGSDSVEAGNGVTREVIGRGRAAAGDVAWAMGDFVFYPGQPASRPPIMWAKGVKPHFANAGALKMYWLDNELSQIEKTVDIPLPTDRTTKSPITATLALHCYNADAEYLVWFAEPESGDYYRCIVQRDGETVADFTSVFANIPSSGMTDAYIDGADLVWVAATADDNSIVMVRYINGVLDESKTYDPQDAANALGNEIDSRYEPAANAATVTVANTTRTQTSTPVITRRDMVFGTKVQETIIGLVVHNSGTFTSADTYRSLIDLWGLDFKMQTSGSGDWHAEYKVHHDQWDASGNLFASYDFYIASAWLEVEAAGNYSMAENAFESLVIVPDSEVVIDENTDTYITQQNSIAKDSDETLTYSVSGAISATAFQFRHDGTSREFLSAPAGCKLTFTSGPNAGQSKIIKNHQGSGSADRLYTYTVTFDSAWGTAPAAGDTFELEVSYATSDWDIVMGDVSLTATCPSADSGGVSTVTTECGNGFLAVQTLPKAITETWQFPSQDIKYDGAVVYSSDARPQDYFPFGAWGPDCGLLINYDDKLLADDGSGVSVTTFSLFNGTVTKRFSK